MKNTILIICLLAVLGIAAFVFADTTFSWSEPGQKGTLTYTNLGLTTPSIAGFTQTGLISQTPTAATLTNGAVLTVASSFYNITASGQANGFTNTVTLANPTAAGDEVTLHVVAASSNLLGLADSGNLKLTAAGLLGDNDTIRLKAPDTSIWVEISRADN
jgi:hypothetical protein